MGVIPDDVNAAGEADWSANDGSSANIIELPSIAMSLALDALRQMPLGCVATRHLAGVGNVKADIAGDPFTNIDAVGRLLGRLPMWYMQRDNVRCPLGRSDCVLVS
mmetsp:Transcript_31145/g.67364  ORF Transcript_31145/g.67364 Transcript_31145/m.67364 type:complete len:106 (+) Transcript_31145:656-973(+)